MLHVPLLVVLGENASIFIMLPPTLFARPGLRMAWMFWSSISEEYYSYFFKIIEEALQEELSDLTYYTRGEVFIPKGIRKCSKNV